MKLISAIVCSMAVVGVYTGAATTASANDAQCNAVDGRDVTIRDGPSACRAASSGSGFAHSAGIDGIGYAGAGAETAAVGLGVAGGVGAGEGGAGEGGAGEGGAGEGGAGVPIAIGVGPDARALTSIDAASDTDRVAITVAMSGSRAQLNSAEPVACLGSAAFAWDSHDGDTCLATPLGLWHEPPPTGT